MTKSLRNWQGQEIDPGLPGIRIFDEPGVPKYTRAVPPRSQNRDINAYLASQQSPQYNPHRHEGIVGQRGSVTGILFEVFAGLGLLAVIIVVLFTCLGGAMVGLRTTGDVPQPVVDYSLGFYHYFFG